MKKINYLFNKRLYKIILFIILDVLIYVFTAFLSINLRFDFNDVPSLYINNLYSCILIDIALMIIIFSSFKLYKSVWRYASITEFINISLSCFALELVTFTYKSAFKILIPRSFYLIQYMLMFILVSSVRYSFRILRTIIININSRKRTINTMIIGAGAAGNLLIEEISKNQSASNLKVVCIIDDNKEKKGTYIRGIKVVGNRDYIKRAIDKYKVKEIIIAIPSAKKEDIFSIIENCPKNGCEIKILPSIYLSMNMEKEKIINNIRPISYEDFLGRDQIVVNNDEIYSNITNKVILVTGGGGSIGSELCRQIAKANPKELIIFDIYENNAYEIEQELKRNYPNLNLYVVIGSVRDYDRLEIVFKKHNINQVFHAAAHKHVPLMEESPNEAIKNNCLGTLNCAKLANTYGAEKFVLISTDKAVRPTNIMGASKRICEMIIQSYDKISQNTDYVAVRFGNVLGSNGSVIPLFLKQIENGGPVTVTHKDITRFFMTIPEAVSLVLQASTYAKGGEIFVLDMGKPVKIYDLAKKIIEYKGLRPNIDIKIDIVGLRPGEKLYEEILMDEEGLTKTPNKLIYIGRPIDIESDFLFKLDDLINDAYNNDENIKEKVSDIIKTYKIDRKKELNDEKNIFSITTNVRERERVCSAGV